MTEYAFPKDLLDGIKTRWHTGSEYVCDQWGLRHQSVFSICHECEQTTGLIVSQDGEVKAVEADNGRLLFWDGILD